MKTLKFKSASLLLIFLVQIGIGQEIISVDRGCSFNGAVNKHNYVLYPASSIAQTIVDDILSTSNKSQNFIVKASNCNRVIAVFSYDQRYILYNPDFIEPLEKSMKDAWAIYGVFAHAIGHHLLGHEFPMDRKREMIELDADKFTANSLYHLKASKLQTISCLNYINDYGSNPIYPLKQTRIDVISKEWNPYYQPPVVSDLKIDTLMISSSNYQCPVYKDLDLGLYIDRSTGKPANITCGGNNFRNGYLVNNEGHVITSIPITKTNTNTSIITTSPTSTDPSMANFLIADFPFPPPECNTSCELAGSAFSSFNILGEVSEKISRALDAKGYPYQFMSVPDGFAIVTQMEQYKRDGTIITENYVRWADTPKNSSFLWSLDYFKSLLFPNKCLLRVFVFIVTTQNFSSDENIIVSKSEAAHWYSQGVNRLPLQVASKPFNEQYGITALVYEFEVPESNHKPKQLCPTQYPAFEHLERSGLKEHLR